jgi:hypothetical protein
MREYTTLELYRLTRSELLRLEHEMAVAVIQLPPLDENRTLAQINLHRIRRELGRREWVLQR